MHRTVPTPWRLACIVVIFVALCGVGTLRAQSPSFPLSAPANPWTAEPVEVKAVLLFFPWDEQGRHYSNASLGTDLQLAFQGLGRPHIGVVRRSAPWSHLESMRHHDDQPGIPVNDGHRETLVRFFGATHVLNSELIVDEENHQWHVHATLDIPASGQSIKRTFTVPRRQMYVLAPQVARWVGEALGDLLTDEDLEILDRPLRGEEFRGSEEAEIRWQALLDDPGSSEWDELIARHPELPYLGLARAGNLKAGAHAEIIRRLAAEPLPAGSHPFRHMERGFLLHDLDPRAALHEWTILAARFPGVDQYSYRLMEYPMSIDAAPEDRMRRVERWHTRANPSPYHDHRLALAYHRAARELRGDGYANTVPEEHWRRISVYSGQAVELVEKSFEEVGPLPIASTFLMDPLVLSGRSRDLHGVFRNSVREYPYYYYLYSGYLNYLYPRWGGSHSMMLAFMDQTLDRHPNWLEPARLVLSPLWAEAALGVDRNRVTFAMQYIPSFLEEKEDWAAVVRKSMEHALGEEATTQSAALALSYAVMLQDPDTIVRIVKEYPEVGNEPAGSFPVFFRPQDYLRFIAMSSYEIGRFEAVLAALDRLELERWYTRDADYRYAYEVTTGIRAASLAFLGRAAESESLWKRLPADHSSQPHRLISWAAANHRVEEVLAEVEPLVAEKPDSIHLVGAYALALAQSGQREKAREVLATVPLFEQNDRWTYLKDACRRVVLGEE